MHVRTSTAVYEGARLKHLSSSKRSTLEVHLGTVRHEQVSLITSLVHQKMHCGIVNAQSIATRLHDSKLCLYATFIHSEFCRQELRLAQYELYWMRYMPYE